MKNDSTIDFFCRLLEMLPQVVGENFGSHINLTIVAPGAQHVNHIGTQNFIDERPQKPKPVSQPMEDPLQLPSPLATPEAMILWQKAIDAGWVDEHYQPLLSRTQAALLADAIAERLSIRDKWKVFEAFWDRKNMYNDYYKAMEQHQSLTFRDELKRLYP